MTRAGADRPSVRREPPYAGMWKGWPRRISIVGGVMGLILALGGLVTGDDASRWRFWGNGLLLPVLALMGALNPWRAARLAGTILAALGAGMALFLGTTDGRPLSELTRWFTVAGLGGFTVIGLVSLWRPTCVLGDPDQAAKKRLSPEAMRGVFRVLIAVAVILALLVAGLLVWVLSTRPGPS